MRFHQRIGLELRLVYVELLRLPPVALLALSCLALFLAASIAFGFHP